MDEKYSSILLHSTAQLKVEGSRFISDVFPANNEIEVKQKLDSVRKKYFDATHHCFAFVIGVEKTNFRYSDDGEPSGTAGIKIHSAIQSKNLSDILVVITRYFGGTKLGVGGLGRAYFEAAEIGISQATFIVKALIQEMQIAFPFSVINPVMNIINSHRLKIAMTTYSGEQSIISLHILPSQIELMRKLFVNATRGTAEVSLGEMKTVNWQ